MLMLNSCNRSLDSGENYLRARKSFVKINVYAAINICDGNQCIKKPFVHFSSASGAAVKYNYKTHILTAAHVCHTENMEDYARTLGGEIEVKFKLVDIRGVTHIGKVVKKNLDADLCLLSSKTLNIRPLRLASDPAKIGEKVYNFAAPAGIYGPPMLPILSGIYSGDSNGASIYSIPATGGSSGSPIVNKNGQLIGMIHSVYTRFTILSVSASYKDIAQFLID